MDLREAGWGKRICLVCGAPLGEELRHMTPAVQVVDLGNNATPADVERFRRLALQDWGTDTRQ